MLRSVTVFPYPHLSHKVLSLCNTVLPNTLFSRDLTPVLDVGLLSNKTKQKFMTKFKHNVDTMTENT